MILDPSFLLYFMRLHADERTTWNGRRAQRAHATWRLEVDPFWIEWPYADETRLVVDAEYGVLLDVEMFLDRRLFLRWQMPEVAFEEEFTDAPFLPLRS